MRRTLPHTRRTVHVFLPARGRPLQRTLVPLATKVNRIAARGVAATDLTATRRTLLAIIANLARDTQAPKRRDLKAIGSRS